jgi:hypothetical protein
MSIDQARSAGCVLCTLGFAIAVLELIGFATTPRQGDILRGPDISILFLPLTLLGLLLTYLSQRGLRTSGQPRSKTAVVAMVLGFLVFPTMWLSFRVELANPAARRGYGETSANSNLRMINSAENSYQGSHAGSFGNISRLIEAGLLDERFDGAKPVSGYVFDIQVSKGEYTATAMPISTDSGRFGYFSNSDGVVRYTATSTPTCKPCFPEGQSGAPVQ